MKLIPKTRLLTAIFGVALLCGACESSSGTGGGSSIVPLYTIDIDPEDLEPACAAFTACVEMPVGVGGCILAAVTATTWDMTRQSFNIGTITTESWIHILSGIQNAACLAQSGGSCDMVLACLNDGLPKRDCTPREGHLQGRYCRDENTLAACSDALMGGGTLETIFRCDEYGMQCVEMVREDDILASCGYQEDGPVTDVQVTCSGDLAKIRRYDTSFYWDCKLTRAKCVPGSYPDWKNYDFCRSSLPECDLETHKDRCTDNMMVNWCNGREIGWDCGAYDQVCRVAHLLTWTLPMCTYDIECDPYSFEEVCRGGKISYCGPEGEAQVSCKKLGFKGCTNYLWFAHCTE